MSERRHILVVEDDPLIRQGLELILSINGFRVTVAPNGAAALEADDRDPADLVVTDLDMPRLDGESLIGILRQRRAALPVVVVSVHPAHCDLGGAHEAPTIILSKPVRPAHLLDAVRYCLLGSVGPLRAGRPSATQRPYGR